MSIENALKYLPRQYRCFMKRGDVSLKQLRFLNAKNYLIDRVLHCKEYGISERRHTTDSQVVVSLTTYGKRLQEVFLPIESIMMGTTLPNRIILWLGEELKDCALPITLQKQMRRGLEVRFCKDIRSYNKLNPTIELCPDDAIITIDDDIIYRFDMVENLVNAYLSNPRYIYCNRMHRMKMDKDKLLPYLKWEWDVGDDVVSPLNFPTGCGGTLYPPHSLSEEVLDENVFSRICPYADDVWYKAMALINDYPSRKVTIQEDTLLFSEENQDIALSRTNVARNQNDRQIKAVFDRYQLYGKLIK